MDLDDLDAINRLDSLDVLGAVEAFGDQCAEGFSLGMAAEDLPDGNGVDSVVVLGMGGSGAAGDIARAIVEPRLPVPYRVIKGYGPLPEWVGRNTLVIAVSHSGDTAEALAAFEEAHARGARAVTISSGGRLAELSVEFGTAHVRIPSGLQPRAALGYLALPLLAVLVGVGLVPSLQDDLDAALDLIAELSERCNRKRSVFENPAKSLAQSLTGSIALIYGGTGIGSTLAYRFKCDLNEYAKALAFSNELPELDHNELVGLHRGSDVARANVVVGMIVDPHDDPRIRTRWDLTRRFIDGRVKKILELTLEGESPTERLMGGLYVTQLAAIYTGLLNGVDPGPVEVLQRLKAELESSLQEGIG